jgi:uncharacterized protein YceK
MRLKPITAIIVLFLMVVSLLVSGCTTNTSSTSNNAPNVTTLNGGVAATNSVTTSTNVKPTVKAPTITPTVVPSAKPTQIPILQKKTLYLDWAICDIHTTFLPGKSQGGNFDFREGVYVGQDSKVHIYVSDYPKVCVPLTITLDGVSLPVTQVCRWQSDYECLARSDSVDAKNLESGTHFVVVTFAGSAEYNPAALTGSFEVIR